MHVDVVCLVGNFVLLGDDDEKMMAQMAFYYLLLLLLLYFAVVLNFIGWETFIWVCLMFYTF